MLQNKMIGRFWCCPIVLVVLWATACSRPSAPAREKFEPSPTRTRHVTFVQWTDPHVFDAGKGRAPEGVREEELDNWAAFHWAVLETNRMVLAEHRNVDFVAITGDFGLENIHLPPVPGQAADTQDCSNPNPEKEGPINRVGLAEAATRVARELDALVVKRVYLVPGNNDLCNEDPRDLHRWAEFVFALQNDLQNLHEARQPIVPANAQNTPAGEKDKALDKVEVFDLTDSLARLCDGSTTSNGSNQRVKALFPNGACPQQQGPYVINGIHLLGLDTASFKNHEGDKDKTLQPAADTANSKEIVRVGDSLHSDRAYLLFTHIPDMKDPFLQPDGKLKSSWKFHDEKTFPGKTTTHENWINILKKPQVLGIFAGHFHISDRTLYPHNFANLTPDPTTAAKFWLAPPLAEKYQFRSPPDKTARGMLLVSVNADGNTRVSGEEGEIVQPSALWYSTADQKTATTGDEKLAQARAEELDHEWEKAATKYAGVLTDPSLDARTRTTALSGYWHAHEMTTKWWWQSRVARWFYLDGLPVLYSVEIILALALIIAPVYAAYARVRRIIPFRGRAIIGGTVQLTPDAPEKEFAARLRAEGEEIKRLLTEEKESWAAGHITLLAPASSSFDSLVTAIPKVQNVDVSALVKFFVSILQTFRWTVQTGIAVFPPDLPTVPSSPTTPDRVVPDAQISAYAVLQWGWIVRNSWHRTLPVEKDRSALGDLARELAALIVGEGFV
jgi:hypothetical protein